MNVVKSKEFWIGVGVTFVVLKFVAPRVPLVSSVTSKLT
jgi:hypothetical protein